MTISAVRQTRRSAGTRRAPAQASGYGNYRIPDWYAAGGSPLEDINQQLYHLRPESRDLYMGGSGIATGALKRFRTKVVGAGLMLRPAPDARLLGITAEQAEDWSYRTRSRFSLWANSTQCDIAGQNNFYDLQQLVMLSWPMNGDAFALLPVLSSPHSAYDLRVQVIEADRVSNPGVTGLYGGAAYGIDVQRLPNGNLITQGVEVDPRGEVVAYHVCNRHPLSLQWATGGAPGWERVAVRGAATGRRNILHVFNPERAEQYRGVPLLAPIMAVLKKIGRYIDAELTASIVAGMVAAVLLTENPHGRGAGLDSATPAPPIPITPGMIVEARAGVTDLKAFNPMRPNSAFQMFLETMVQIVGSATEIPPEVLMLHFTSSYSASRAALLEFWSTCRMMRSWLSRMFCQPVYEEWLAEDIARGNCDAPGFFDNPLQRAAWCNAVWTGPAPGHIQPKQEIDAAISRMTSGIGTGDDEAMQFNGSDYGQNLEQLAVEESRRQRLGLPSLFAAGKPGAGETPAAPDNEHVDTLRALLEDDPEMLAHLEAITEELAATAGTR